jgi:hypothetical protein
MKPTDRRLSAAFCARVGECRTLITGLLASEESSDRDRLATRMDELYCLLANALRSGARAGLPAFDELAQQMQESLPALREAQGFAEPRLRALVRSVLVVLERAVRLDPVGEEVARLVVELRAATHDAGWADHVRCINGRSC